MNVSRDSKVICKTSSVTFRSISGLKKAKMMFSGLSELQAKRNLVSPSEY